MRDVYNRYLTFCFLIISFIARAIFEMMTKYVDINPL